MSNLRKEARDRPCMVRTPACNPDPATTVLAHLNGAGMGRKADDALGAWACGQCHSWLDGGYAKTHSRDERDLYHLKGMARTVEVLRGEGKL